MAGFPLKTYGPPVPVPGQLTDAQRQSAAQDYVRSLIAPLRTELKGITATGDRQAQNAQDVYGALASLQQQQQGSIQQGYSQAAEQQNAFSKGYSDAVQQQQQQSVAAPNALLKSIGAPEGQQISPGNIGSLLYGTSGVIPSVSLSKQGAAQGAIQALNPIFARQAGIAQGDLIQSTAAQKYADTLASLNNKIPGLVQKQIYDQQRLAQQYDIASAKAKSAAAQKLIDNAFRKRGLDIQEYSARRPRVGSGGGGGGSKPFTASQALTYNNNLDNMMKDYADSFIPKAPSGLSGLMQNISGAQWTMSPSELAKNMLAKVGPYLKPLGLDSNYVGSYVASLPGYSDQQEVKDANAAALAQQQELEAQKSKVGLDAQARSFGEGYSGLPGLFAK